MKLKNKKTGEIAEFIVHKRVEDSEDGNKVYAQVVINPEEWEDYEDPVGYWYVSEQGIPGRINFSWDSKESIENHKEIGNYFETYEEAEKAVEKLKAWKRLKDSGFRFLSYNFENDKMEFLMPNLYEKIHDDLDLLFGGEE